MADSIADNTGYSKRPLRLLLVEDNPMDAELTVATLMQAGYALHFDVVDLPGEFQRRLERGEYNLILADYNLRTWTGMDALELLQKSGKDVPLIVVSGSLGDEAAVECIKKGAADYVLKDRLARLPIAVRYALEEREHREEAARLAERIKRGKKEWEVTFDTVPDPVLLLNRTYQIRRANRAAAALAGLEPGQLVGKRCCEVLHAHAELCQGCPVERTMNIAGEARAEIQHAGLGKFFDVTASPLWDPAGGLQGCVEVWRDITERKRAEEALRRSGEQYRLMFETNPQPMWVFDRETLSFLAANEAAIQHYGYSREEFLSLTLKEICPRQDLPGLLARD